MRDSITFAATLRIDNGEYIAWAINAEGRGLIRAAARVGQNSVAGRGAIAAARSARGA